MPSCYPVCQFVDTVQKVGSMPCSVASLWVYATFDIIAVIGIFLLACVMQQAQRDRACKNDAPWIREARRASFIGAQLALVFAVLDTLSPLSTLILVGSSIGLLSINALALRMRQPPNSGARERTPVNLGAKKTPI